MGFQITMTATELVCKEFVLPGPSTERRRRVISSRFVFRFPGYKT